MHSIANLQVLFVTGQDCSNSFWPSFNYLFYHSYLATTGNEEQALPPPAKHALDYTIIARYEYPFGKDSYQEKLMK